MRNVLNKVEQNIDAKTNYLLKESLNDIQLRVRQHMSNSVDDSHVRVIGDSAGNAAFCL